MSVLRFGSSARGRYLAFLTWGLVQGVLSFLMWLFLAGRHPKQDLEILTLCILSGVALSGIVFGLLLKTPEWFQSLGFVIVSALIPYAVFVSSTSLSYTTVNLVPDPLALAVLLLWTVCMLPFALLAAVGNLSMWFRVKRKRNKSRLAPGVTLE